MNLTRLAVEMGESCFATVLSADPDRLLLNLNDDGQIVAIKATRAQLHQVALQILSITEASA